ncbi:MAG: hypothetical protein IPP00_14300 [Actinomycetales bacterium]|uniref:Uncharacterized protein n=1 Tax=Candidatus Phosphoribacter hodrii TaxID=2953743 RepID=A0A9D7Y335_9MICO|nr:hypothetical protein [Candidatus Phosphoribacter hodrii]
MGGPVPNSAVGPGLGAFLAFFALAVALYFLMRNMNARMRRMAYRERDRIAALEAAEAAKSGTSTPADSGPTATPGDAAAQGDAAARKPKRKKPNEP